MKYFALTAMAGVLLGAPVLADDPVPSPSPDSTPAAAPALPSHVDTTVVGSSIMGQPGDAAPPSLDSNHDFTAGAPELKRITKRLKLSAKQESQLHEVIEKSDAGAGVLIEREHDVQQMISATTPADPKYAQLIADQSAGEAQWTENRKSLRQNVLNILTPAQQRRFEELEAQQAQQAQR